MAQPSVACYFNTRKRSAVENNKINHAKKVLVLDSDKLITNNNVLNGPTCDKGYAVLVCSEKIADNEISKCDLEIKAQNKNLQQIFQARIASQNFIRSPKPVRRASKTSKIKKVKDDGSQKHIEDVIANMLRKEPCGEAKINEEKAPKVVPTEAVTVKEQEKVKDTPDPVYEEIPLAKEQEGSNKLSTVSSEKASENEENEKVKEVVKKPQAGSSKSINAIKKNISKSAKLAELKASIARFNDSAKKLEEIEKRTAQITSPKLKNFKTIELEVPLSPQKLLSPEKAYLSPKKDLSAKRNLLNLLSPTKNAVALTAFSPTKKILETASKPALTLPFKYRYLAEMFRAIDTVTQILFNRKETVTFRKLKPAVEEMLKRNLTEKHLSQIKNIYPQAYCFTQEKLRVFGTGNRQEQWELVLKPVLNNNEFMTSEILLERRRMLFNILIDKVKDYHSEFLSSLDPPMNIPKDKITRWHPEFDIEKLPDIEQAELPKPPAEEKFTTGREVLEKARQMFNCNTRMEQALERLKAAREANVAPVEEPKQPTSVLKGIPKALLEKVRQKQAAKAFVSMTRSADKEQELLLYSRLPEIARITRNIFVTEKKNVLPLDTVISKLENCYTCRLTKTEMENHLRTISKEVEGWLIFHDIRNCLYVKLQKNADLSLVLSKLEALAKQKNES